MKLGKSQRVFAVEFLERRQLLSGIGPAVSSELATVYGIAETNFQSADATLQFQPTGPTAVVAGQTLTVQTTSTLTLNVFCSASGGPALVDGTPTPSTAETTPTTYDYAQGAPKVVAGSYVTVPAGMHTISFTINATTQPQSVYQTTDPNNGFISYNGPWVVVNGFAGGNIFSSPLPFEVTGQNKLVFTHAPTGGAPGTTISPAITVAVEDSNNQILDDNGSQITLAIAESGLINTTLNIGTATATMVHGIATFDAVSIPNAGKYTMFASAGGYATGQGGGIPLEEPVGMSTSTGEFSIATGGSSGGGSGSLTAAVAKSTLGSSLIAGTTSHGSVSVKITNTGNGSENSRATVAVYASNDGTVDGNSIQLGSVSETLHIRSKKSSSVSIHVRSIPGTLAGTYQLLTKVTDSLGNVSISSSGPTLTAAAPFVSLVPELAKTTIANRGKSAATVSFAVINNGNVASKGQSTINFYSSTDGTLATASLVFSKKLTLAVPAHKKHAGIRVTIPTAQSATLLAAPDVLLQVVDAASDQQTISITF